MADSPGKFAGELRELRRHARLTQQELADAAGLSLRTVSDLERGVAATPQKETVGCWPTRCTSSVRNGPSSRLPGGAVPWRACRSPRWRRRSGRCRET